MIGTVLYDGAVYLPKEDFGNDWKKYGAHNLFITSSFNRSEITDEEVMQAALIKKFYIGYLHMAKKYCIFIMSDKKNLDIEKGLDIA